MNVSQIKPARVNPLLLHADECRISLDGNWRFRLDPGDEGVAESWFQSSLHVTGEIQVPGCWQGQGHGGDGNDRIWDFNLDTRVFQATYKGTGWYAHTFGVPAEWSGKRLWLNFGGVHPSAEIWLNGHRIGENELPFVPFGFDVTDVALVDGTNDIVVRVHEHNREFGLAYSWQGNWSGLYRGVDLVSTGPAWLTRCAILPDAVTQSICVRVQTGRIERAVEPLSIAVHVSPINSPRESLATGFELSGSAEEFVIPIPNPVLWTPDSPQLYRVDVTLNQNGAICDARSERVGFVLIEPQGKYLCIGGEPYYMRGTGDFISCPETGSPDTDRDRWRRKLQTLRNYGYNFVRCQSFVYGPEYYDIADEVGILIQSEMGILGAWGGHSPYHSYQWPKPTLENYPILKEQWDLVVERDACHPSASIYCMSNEYGDNTDFPRMAWECYHSTKLMKRSAMVIWTDGGYNKDLPGDFINHTTKALKPEQLAEIDKPIIEHEYQWWSSFPDVRSLAKFTGAVRPYAAKIASDMAALRGQTHLLEAYAENSQRLQYIESKAKMENLRRDNPVLAGVCHFNAMDVNPSPQGIVDEFYEHKLIDAAVWQQTNGDTVVLCSLGFDDRCWRSGQSVHVSFSVSDFAHPPLHKPRLRWAIRVGDDIVDGGNIDFEHSPYTTTPAGYVTITAPAVAVPIDATLEVKVAEISAREVQNRWSVWIFPEAQLPTEVAVFGEPKWTWMKHWNKLPVMSTPSIGPKSTVILAETLNDELIGFMRRGGRVLLAAGEGLVRPHSPLFGYVKYFFTPPANYSPYEDGQNGTVIASHSMLGGFPHQGFADWQFFRLIENSPPLDIGPLGLADGDPVIRVIHRYPTLHPLAYLIERRVGQGALLLCALELNPAWIEAQWLMNEICRYVASDICQPQLEMPDESLRQILAATSNL